MNIKQKIRHSLIPQWKIAHEIGISEPTMVRWLRMPEELDKDKVQMIEKALQKLQKEGK